MKAFFNELIPGEDDLGTILYGDYSEFADRVKLLDDNNKQIYTDALQDHEIIEIEKEDE